MTTLTKQEELFLNRAAEKMIADQTLTIEAALRSVLEDDVRILNTVFSMSKDGRDALEGALCAATYRAINQ